MSERILLLCHAEFFLCNEDHFSPFAHPLGTSESDFSFHHVAPFDSFEWSKILDRGSVPDMLFEPISPFAPFYHPMMPGLLFFFGGRP